MTVEELIKDLSTCNPKATVYWDFDGTIIEYSIQVEDCVYLVGGPSV